MVTDHFSKLTKTVSLRTTTAQNIAKAFTTHRIILIGPPSKLFADTGKQLSLRSFTDVYRILDSTNLSTATYHTQTNGQNERFNRTLLAASHHYVGDDLRTWDEFTGALIYAYNNKPHCSTSFASLEFVLTCAPPNLALEALQAIMCRQFPRQWFLQ